MKTTDELNELVVEIDGRQVDAGLSVGETIEVYARGLCGAVLQACDGDREKAAAMLRSNFGDMVMSLRDRSIRYQRVN